MRPDEGGERSQFRRERTTNLTNLTNLRNRRIFRNGKLPPGGRDVRDAAGWLSDSSADSLDSSDSWFLLLFLVLCLGGRL